jgi:hypothetical protein
MRDGRIDLRSIAVSISLELADAHAALSASPPIEPSAKIVSDAPPPGACRHFSHALRIW